MKSKIVLLVLALCLLVSHAVLAADIPTRSESSHIADTANMLSKNKVEQVEKAAQGKNYSFYLLTIASLEGADPAEYASSAYKLWGLQTEDVLILVAKDDRRTEMNFRNPELLAQLEAKYGTEKNPISQLVAEYFNPFAKAGDFAGASIALMNATDWLKPAPAETTNPQTGQPSDSAATAPAASPLPQPAATLEGHTSSSQAPVPWKLPLPTRQQAYIGLGALAALILLGLLCYGTFKQMQWRWLRKKAEKLLVNAMLASEQLRPFVGMLQGNSERVVNELETQLDELLVEATDLLNSLRDTQLAIYKVRQLKQNVGQWKADYRKLAAILAEADTGIKHLVDVDKTIKSDIEQLTGQLAVLQSDVDKFSHESAYPLPNILQRLQRIEQELKQADELAALDPLEADRIAEAAEGKLQTTDQDVKDILRYHSYCLAFAENLMKLREEIETIVQENRLKLLHIDPYGNLNKAKDQAALMLEHLKLGAIDEVRTLADSIDSLMNDAMEMTKRHAHLRKKNSLDIPLIREKLAALHETDRRLSNQFARVRISYAEKHWNDAWERYMELDQCLKRFREQLDQANLWSNDDNQNYDEARKLLDAVLEGLGTADKYVDECQGVINQLDKTLERLRKEYDKGWAIFTNATTLIQNKDIRFHPGYDIERMTQQVHLLQGQAEHVHSGNYIDLSALEQVIVQLKNEAQQFADMVNRVLANKQKAEQTLRSYQSNYHSVHNKVRSRLNTSRYKHQFTSYVSSVEELISHGYYEEAVERAQDIHPLLRSMEQEYSNIVVQEAKSRESDSSDSSGSSNSSDSNSSGGSSWSSDSDSSSSNSSGGSSWGSNDDDSNKNSSGGSNW